MLLPPLPACGEDNAPHFDADRPRELRRFFAELSFLFTRSQISNDAEMKHHALRYADYNSADLWELLPEFSDPMQTFNAFIAAVYRLYPECDEEHRWSLADMDALVVRTMRTGIASLAELGSY